MNGIKMSDCLFYVNEDERTVVCVIPNTKYLLINYINEHFDFPDLEISTMGKLDKGLLMPKSFCGKAVCSEDDAWNEEAGKVLAYSRARDKCYKSFFKRANLFVQTFDRRLGDMIDSFNDFGMALETRKDHIDNRLTELLEE